MEEFFKEWFKDASGNLSSFNAMVSKYLPPLITLLIALIAIHFITNFAKKMIKKSKIPRTIHSFLVSGIKFTLHFVVLLVFCSRLGIDVTSLVAAFSIVGVAISLSVQNLLSNVMSGFNILGTKQFDVDDYIETAGVSGIVQRIGLTSCKLKSYDGKDIYIPNSSIISEKIINYSREPYRRVDISIGASYSEEVSKVKTALNHVIEDTVLINREMETFCGITKFDESSVQYTIRVWVRNSDYWTVYFEMLERIKLTFEKENIEIPFNQLDVHVKND
jgi:small conductance mechanosensitive channel